MKKIARKRENENQPEMITLDGYVNASGKARADILYARVDEEIGNMLFVGDLVVSDMTRKPALDDLVLLRVPEGVTVRRYRHIKHLLNPLKLVISADKPPSIEIPANRCEVVGVVTHIIKNVIGGAR